VAIAPYNRPEEAFVRFAREMGFPISTRVLDSTMDVIASKLDLDWSDWSGAAAARRLPLPVFLIGGEKDPISPPRDLEQIKQAAAAGTEMLLVPEANHFVIGFAFQQLAEPVKAWFQARL
jgi:pimeloyl-ACP methyl ester carboxylesterase